MGAVLDSVLLGEYQGGRSGELGEQFANGDLHGRRSHKFDALCDKGSDRPDVFVNISQNLR